MNQYRNKDKLNKFTVQVLIENSCYLKWFFLRTRKVYAWACEQAHVCAYVYNKLKKEMTIPNNSINL